MAQEDRESDEARGWRRYNEQGKEEVQQGRAETLTVPTLENAKKSDERRAGGVKCCSFTIS
jgi:hypothetical protein